MFKKLIACDGLGVGSLEDAIIGFCDRNLGRMQRQEKVRPVQGSIRKDIEFQFLVGHLNIRKQVCAGSFDL